jgi:hypothetical protein
LSDCQLDWNEGAEGDVVLTVEIDGRTIRKHEWMEEGRTYREWLIPATLLNALAVTKRAHPIASQTGKGNQRRTGCCWTGPLAPKARQKMPDKVSDEDREAIRKLKARMYMCWLDMIGAEKTEANLNELHSIHAELSRILGKYDVGGNVSQNLTVFGTGAALLRRAAMMRLAIALLRQQFSPNALRGI